MSEGKGYWSRGILPVSPTAGPLALPYPPGLLTRYRACRLNGHQDRGLQGHRATHHAAHILARVNWGHLV